MEGECPECRAHREEGRQTRPAWGVSKVGSAKVALVLQVLLSLACSHEPSYEERMAQIDREATTEAARRAIEAAREDDERVRKTFLDQENRRLRTEAEDAKRVAEVERRAATDADGARIEALVADISHFQADCFPTSGPPEPVPIDTCVGSGNSGRSASGNSGRLRRRAPSPDNPSPAKLRPVPGAKGRGRRGGCTEP